MTLRQLWVRVRALPADSPLVSAIRADQEDAEHRELANDIDDALSLIRKG